MRWLILPILWFFSCVLVCAQIEFKIEDDIKYADMRILVSKDVTQPNLRVEIGPSVKHPDLRVGITKDRAKASFIIVKRDYADVIVRAGADVNFEDLRVLVGEDVEYPDVWIQTKTSGDVDYAIYTEKDSVNMAEMITVLLPVLNRHMKRQNARVSALFGE